MHVAAAAAVPGGGPRGAPALALFEILDPDRAALLAALHALVGDDRPFPGAAKVRFPGPNPVSLERAELARLRAADYYVCEKTDGVRYALLCCRLGDKDVIALVDRRLRTFLLPLGAVPTAMFQGSVLDGELAWNKSAARWQYLAFDATMLSGVPVFHAGLAARLEAARVALRAYERRADDAIDLRIKEFVTARDAGAVRAHMERAARFFDVDGVVLTPAADGVVFGRHTAMFKLKGGFAEHTVDFLSGEGGRLLVFDAGRHVEVARATRPLPAGGVVECRFVSDARWEPLLVRTDKATANDMLTFRKTVLNIREALGLDEVLAACN